MAWNEPGGGNRNPWERRPGQGGSELDEIVRNWQRRLAGIFGAGRTGRPPGGSARVNWGAIALLIAAAWGATGFYMVDAAERAVVLRFGRHTETTDQGLHWHWPYPIERVAKVNVAKNDSIGDDKIRMLTADENLVDITIAVQFIRADPLKFLFNVRDPESTLRDVSESAI